MDSWQYSPHSNVQTSVGPKSQGWVLCHSQGWVLVISQGWVIFRLKGGYFANTQGWALFENLRGWPFGFLIAGSQNEIWLLPLQFLI